MQALSDLRDMTGGCPTVHKRGSQKEEDGSPIAARSGGGCFVQVMCESGGQK